MVKIVVGIICICMALLNKEDLKHKLADAFIGLSSGLGVYLSIPDLSTNFYFQEIAKSVISIGTATIILVISLFVRHWYDKKYKK